MLLNNQEIIKGIKGKIRNLEIKGAYFNISKNLLDIAKGVLRGRFKAKLSSKTRKIPSKQSKFSVKELEKEKQMKKCSIRSGRKCRNRVLKIEDQ